MHLISAKQFNTRHSLSGFFNQVSSICSPYGARTYQTHRAANGKIMAALFYEPSTRTRFSFEAAMHKLGGAVISEGNPKMLSVSKGETLEDTILTVSQYADVIVLRHPQKGAAARAASVSEVPIINAGDGDGEHPTQALLDMFTIHQNFKLDGIKVLLCGDLKNGRTVHSLVTLLSLYDKVELCCTSPKSLTLPQNVLDYLKDMDVKVSFFASLQEGLKQDPNVVYMTRLQKERMSPQLPMLPVELLNSDDIIWNDYCLTPELMNLLNEKSLVLHPLPRNEELAGAVDKDPRCIYFTKQVKNGLKVRMGLLYCLFTGKLYYGEVL